MRVVTLAGCPFSKPRFGVSEYVFQLTRALGAMDVDIHLVSVSNADIKEFSKVRFHPIPRKLIYYLIPPLAASAIVRKVEAIRPDLVHVHGSTLPYAWAAIALSKRKMPVVATFHGDIRTELGFTKDFFKRAWMKCIQIPVYEKLLRHICKIFVVSKELQNSLISRGYKARVITSGVNLEEFDPTGLQKDEFSYLLYLGQLSKIKGVDILVNALLEVNKRFGKIQAVIAGTGPESNSLMDFVNTNHLADSVTFPGFVHGKQKYSLIKNSSLMIFPFREGSGLSIALLEALAAGKAIIASKATDTPEVIVDGENGLLIEDLNPTTLAEKIIYMIKHPEIRNALGRKARDTAQAYSWENIALSYKMEYTEFTRRHTAI